MQSGTNALSTLATLALSLTCCFSFTQSAVCQTGVVVKLSDQTTQTGNRPAPARRVVLSANWVAQESDFEPRKKGEQENETQKDAKPDSTKDDDISLVDPFEDDKTKETKDGEDDPTQLKDSDKPVDPPNFEIDETVESDTNDGADSNSLDSKKTEVPQDEYRLPEVANVHAPISMMPLAGVRQSDPSGLLLNDQLVNRSSKLLTNNVSYAGVSGKMSQPKYKTWQAHNFYHQPLYFEEHNVERHGNRRPFERVASTMHFFGTIPQLPYRLGSVPPYQRVYTHGQTRPGDYSQFQIVNPPPNRQGNFLQTMATLGLILP